ncbi:MAG: glycosyltransferase family 2 protein [Puniceicoccales bacterium]
MPSLSFVIPVYNEEETLGTLFDEIAASVPHDQFEVVFVDDGSRDRSWERIGELHAKHGEQVRGVRFRRNFGKAAGLKAGFEAAKGEIVFTMDADLQDVPAEIPNFLAKLDEGADMVSGWKKERHDPLEKRLPSKLFNAITSWSTGLYLHDFNCGFKAYRREIVENINLYGELHRFVPAIAHSMGYRVVEIPVQHRPREHGQSKYGFGRYLKGCLDLLTVVLTTKFNTRPLHLFGGFGMATGSIGFLILFYLSASKVLMGASIGGRPLFFLGILLVLFAGQMVSTGLLAELLVTTANRNQPMGSAQIRDII